MHAYLSLSLSLSLSRARARSLYARARWARMWGWQEHWTAQQTHQGQVSGMHMRVMSAASASSVARTLRPALVSILKRPHYRERTHSIAREHMLCDDGLYSQKAFLHSELYIVNILGL